MIIYVIALWKIILLDFQNNLREKGGDFVAFNGLNDEQVRISRRKNRTYVKKSRRITFSKKLNSVFSNTFIITYYIVALLAFIAFLSYVIFTKDYSYLKIMILLAISVIFITSAIAVSAFLERKFDSVFILKNKSIDDSRIKTYRCGNEIYSIKKSDLVVGDYVYLQNGDICPANGMVLWGDASVSSETGNRIVRNFGEDIFPNTFTSLEISEGETISSGYLVYEITEIPKPKNPLISSKWDKSYTLSIIFGFLSFGFTCGVAIFGAINSVDIPIMLLGFVSFAGFIPLASSRFRSINLSLFVANSSALYSGGIQIKKDNIKPSVVFIDKHNFFTKNEVSSGVFINGEVSSFGNFSEIPYPLGTLLTLSVVENASVHVNRRTVISSNPYEKAEVSYVFERIMYTSELEIDIKKINGTERDFNCQKYNKGTAEEIISFCEYYFSASGEVKPLENHAALIKKAAELSSYNNRVVAYSAITNDGLSVFVGMITFRESLKLESSTAVSAINGQGTKLVLLGEFISEADLSLMNTTRENVFSSEAISNMSDEELAENLPKIKIISGNPDFARLIKAAEKNGKTPALAVNSFDAFDEDIKPYIFYAAAESSMLVKSLATAVFSDGAISFAKYAIFSKRIKQLKRRYFLLHTALVFLAAVIIAFTYRLEYSFVILPIAVILSLILRVIFLTPTKTSEKINEKLDEYR